MGTATWHDTASPSQPASRGAHRVRQPSSSMALRRRASPRATIARSPRDASRRTGPGPFRLPTPGPAMCESTCHPRLAAVSDEPRPSGDTATPRRTHRVVEPRHPPSSLRRHRPRARGRAAATAARRRRRSRPPCSRRRRPPSDFPGEVVFEGVVRVDGVTGRRAYANPRESQQPQHLAVMPPPPPAARRIRARRRRRIREDPRALRPRRRDDWRRDVRVLRNRDDHLDAVVDDPLSSTPPARISAAAPCVAGDAATNTRRGFAPCTAPVRRRLRAASSGFSNGGLVLNLVEQLTGPGARIVHGLQRVELAQGHRAGATATSSGRRVTATGVRSAYVFQLLETRPERFSQRRSGG